MCLYDKDPNEWKYQFLLNTRESTGLKHLNDSKVFIEFLNEMEYIYKRIEQYNSNKKQKILLVSDDLVADILNNKKRNPINYLSEVESWTSLLFLLQNLILPLQKVIG